MTLRNLSPLAVWGLLVTATALSYVSWLDADWIAPQLAGSLVILLALVKAWLIGMRYMELDEAVRPLRMAYNAWVVVVGAVLLTMFWQA